MDLVFTKELVYCLPESFYPDIISEGFTEFTHTFLIRDPERAIPSNYKVTVNEQFDSGYLVPTSGGFEEAYNLFNFIKEKKGLAPIVVDVFYTICVFCTIRVWYIPYMRVRVWYGKCTI